MALIALIGGAFFAGDQLRTRQMIFTSSPPYDAPVQASVLLKLTPEWSPVAIPNSKQGGNENQELISAVLKQLKTYYVEPITGERETALARGAVRGMLNSLNDPDSRFLDPTERKLLDDVGTGKFHGIGAVLALKNEKVSDLDVTKIVVVAPMHGSPAEKAGLQPGDSITYINDKWIVTQDPFKEAGMEKLSKAARNKEIDELTYQKAYEAAYNKLKEGLLISQALDDLTSKSSGELNIRVERPGQHEPLNLKLQCRKTEIDPVSSYMLKRGIAYIRVAQFNKRAMGEFASELNRVKAAHAKAFILDLRGNPGGLMGAAINITSRIAGGGVMAKIQTKSGRRAITMPNTRGLHMPIAVLVDGGTASVAELVAGTLRDNSSACIVGTKTFGDGLTQRPLTLRDGSVAIMTVGKMLTAKGFDFEGKGLTPDREVLQGQRHGDVQLKEAESILLTKLGKA